MPQSAWCRIAYPSKRRRRAYCGETQFVPTSPGNSLLPERFGAPRCRLPFPHALNSVRMNACDHCPLCLSNNYPQASTSRRLEGNSRRHRTATNCASPAALAHWSHARALRDLGWQELHLLIAACQHGPGLWWTRSGVAAGTRLRRRLTVRGVVPGRTPPRLPALLAPRV